MAYQYNLRKDPKKSAKAREGIVGQEDVTKKGEDNLSMEGREPRLPPIDMDGRNEMGESRAETVITRHPLTESTEDVPATKEIGIETASETSSTHTKLSQENVRDTIQTVSETDPNLMREFINIFKGFEIRMIDKMDELKDKTNELNTKTNELNTKTDELNTKTDELNTKTDLLTIQMEEQRKEIREDMQDIKDEFNYKIEIYTKEITEKLNKGNQRIEEKYDAKIEDIEQEIEQVKIDCNRDIKIKIGENNKIQKEQLVSKFNEIQSKLPDDIREHTKVALIQHKEELSKMIEDQHKEMTSIMHHQSTEINHHNEVLINHSDQINKTQIKLRNIENKVSNLENTTNQDYQTDLNKIPEIIINYLGNHPNDPQISLPKFTSKHRNPPQFLKQFQKYYQNYSNRRRINDQLTYLELLEQCFEDSSSSWFNIVKLDIGSEEEFKMKFLKQYWSKDIQREIKKRLEIENYKEEGKMTRTEYLIDRATTLKSMSLEETEIVDLLSNNFTEQIKAMVKVQNITTLDRFIEILNREDLEARTNRIRKNQNENRNNHPYQNNRDAYHKYQQHIPSRQMNRYSNPNSNYRNHNETHVNLQQKSNYTRPNNNHHNNPNEQWNRQNKIPYNPNYNQPRHENRHISYMTLERRTPTNYNYPTDEQNQHLRYINRNYPHRRQNSLSLERNNRETIRPRARSMDNEYPTNNNSITHNHANDPNISGNLNARA